MLLRPYRPVDCPALATLFYDTVHTVCRRDYSAAQCDAWADGMVDLEEWNRSFLAHITWIAEQDGQIIGFGDIGRDGYLDRLYVHRDFQRQGWRLRCVTRWKRRLQPDRSRPMRPAPPVPSFWLVDTGKSGHSGSCATVSRCKILFYKNRNIDCQYSKPLRLGRFFHWIGLQRSAKRSTKHNKKPDKKHDRCIDR